MILTIRWKIVVAPALALALIGCGGRMDHKEASDKLTRLVDDALDAGLDSKSKPKAFPLRYSTCTDDILGPTSKARPTYLYRFPYGLLEGDGPLFADKATATWKKAGLKISLKDSAETIQRFAVSESGFHLSLTINPAVDQVSIGGSGPCVRPPDGAI